MMIRSGLKKMDQAGKPRAEISGLFAEQRQAGRIALARAFHNVAGLDHLRCGPDAEQAFGVHRCRLAGAASKRSSRGESFEASDRPARANWPFERHAKMPDMARHAATAVQQPTIDHNPATDASADSHIDEMSPSRDRRHRVGDAPESVITGISALQLRALADQRQKS
jgi:hypothetical protein